MMRYPLLGLAWLTAGVALAGCGDAPGPAPAPPLLQVEAAPTLATRTPPAGGTPGAEASLIAAAEEQPPVDQRGGQNLKPSKPTFQDAYDERLRFLADVQRTDGGWDEDLGAPGDVSDDVDLTATVLHAFARAGYTNRGSHPFAKVVSRGARFLKNHQDADGRFGPATGLRTDRAHVVATSAILDLYALTGSPIYKRAAVMSLEHLQSLLRDGAIDTAEEEAWALRVLLVAHAVRAEAKRREKPDVLGLDDEAFAPLAAWTTAAGHGSDLEHALGGLALLLWPPEEHARDALLAWQRGARTFAWDPAVGMTDPLAALMTSLPLARGDAQLRRSWLEAFDEAVAVAQVPTRDDDPLGGSLDPARAGHPSAVGRIRRTALLAAADTDPLCCYVRYATPPKDE